MTTATANSTLDREVSASVYRDKKVILRFTTTLKHVGGGVITLDGYGSNKRSDYTVDFEGKTHRVYWTCHSNCASFFIKVGSRKIFFN